MFFLKPTPKQVQQLIPSAQAASIAIPDRWEDFAQTLTIRSGKGFKKFEPFPMQIQLSDLVDVHPFTMIPKTRQLGVSQWALSKILHEMLKTPGINCVCISKRNLDAYKLGRRMIQMIDSASIPTIRKSAAEIVLYNESRCVFAEPGDNAARSEDSVSIVLLDEFSAMAEPELTMAAALPTTSMVEDFKCWIVFTPNGKSNYSYKLLSENNPAGMDLISTIKAVREGYLPPLYHWIDTDGWLKVLLHWRAHPVFSQNPDYLEHVAKSQKLPWKRVLREHDLSFDEGEMQFIPDEDIDACAILEEYQDSEEDCKYYAGLDSSSVGRDYFAFAILKDCGDRLALVHLYRARRRSMKRHLVRIGQLCQDYGIEAAMVESNSFGQLYYEELSQDYRDVAWMRFNASQRSNIEILERMLMRIETRTLLYPSDPIVLRELRGLEADPISGRIEAGNSGISGDSEDDELHDDVPRAIALAIAAYEDRPKHQLFDVKKIRFVGEVSASGSDYRSQFEA